MITCNIKQALAITDVMVRALNDGSVCLYVSGVSIIIEVGNRFESEYPIVSTRGWCAPSENFEISKP